MAPTCRSSAAACSLWSLTVSPSGTGASVYPARTERITRLGFSVGLAASGVSQSASPPPWSSNMASPSPPESVKVSSTAPVRHRCASGRA